MSLLEFDRPISGGRGREGSGPDPNQPASAGIVFSGVARSRQEPRSISSVEQAPARSLDLVRRAQSGEREAFDMLYHDHAGRVYGICLRMSGDAGEAERLTQDAFVKLWQRMASFRGDSAFSSWLYRLTVNVVLEDARANRRRLARVEPMEDPGEHERGHAPEAAETESRMALEQAIAGLPPGARHVFVLHDLEGYKHEEIARLGGIAVGTVKAQLHRARKLLREKLDR